MRVKCGAIIVAAGSGRRMGGSISKQFLNLGKKPIIVHTVEKFEEIKEINEIIVVTSMPYIQYVQDLKREFSWKKVKIVEGGKERYNSVLNGLNALGEDIQTVLIHDGVRPFVTEKNILDVIEKTQQAGACILAVPVKDTIKAVDGNGMVTGTPDRNTLWSVQTPQGFNLDLLKKAYQSTDNFEAITDDAMVMEKAGYTVTVVKGSYENIKITTPEDLAIGMAMETQRGKEYENT
ncbi:2-C-methyl-D-erythritol 4-phosphate cytidylyltransferase [bioreactor metagenome]|uniref:2-C-methyl-D-erythritol 4-phosphate cytidylyltransferase n=1 Tax=bioreactor metagenome TaxID=1076179 RepID=A0A645GHQ9_9ZZZZ|nr:2-C-methyl-D-erythritol 4-phosphate cytidylyltransferase [Lachnospiraceae bacterium]